jgi:hypothetical protein
MPPRVNSRQVFVSSSLARRVVFNTYPGKLVLTDGADGMNDTPEVTLGDSCSQFAKYAAAIQEQSERIIVRRNAAV